MTISVAVPVVEERSAHFLSPWEQTLIAVSGLLGFVRQFICGPNDLKFFDVLKWHEGLVVNGI